MGGFDVDSIRAHHDEQRARAAATEPSIAVRPRRGDRVSYSIRNHPEVPARVGIVDSFENDDGIEVVFIRGEQWEFGSRINLDSFDLASDSVHVAEMLS